MFFSASNPSLKIVCNADIISKRVNNITVHPERDGVLLGFIKKWSPHPCINIWPASKLHDGRHNIQLAAYIVINAGFDAGPDDE